MDEYERSEAEMRYRAFKAKIDRIAEEAQRKREEMAAKAQMPKQPRKAKLTKAERERYGELILSVSSLMLDMRWPQIASSYLPAEWADIDATPVPEKTRITLRVDVDVAKFYRKLGPGYQSRMNEVLRSFMLARLVEIIGLGPQPL